MNTGWRLYYAGVGLTCIGAYLDAGLPPALISAGIFLVLGAGAKAIWWAIQ